MQKLVYQIFIFLSIILLVLGTVIIISCDSSTSSDDDNTSNATVAGNLVLPLEAPGKNYAVLVDNDFDGDNGQIKLVTGTCGSGTNVNYSISNVPAGTFYIYAAVFVVSDGSSGPQSGDYVGIYGGTLTNPPNQANASVPSSGTVTIDITLEKMP
jgi:hypothetical protein